MISIFNQTYKYTYKIKHIQALTTPSRQETQHAPSLPRGDATEAPVGRGAWQRRTSRPGKGRFETVLPRDHAPESSVSRVAVAEDRRSTGKRPISGWSDTRPCLWNTCSNDNCGRNPRHLFSGGRVSLAGVVVRDLVSGRGPRL